MSTVLRSALCALVAVLALSFAASAGAADRFVPIGQGTYDVPGFAESLDLSSDGRKVTYASPDGTFLLDIADPTRPRLLGQDGRDTTSVAFTADDRYVLAVDQSVPASGGPSDEYLRVLDGRTLEQVRGIPIAGGDAVHVSPDGHYAAIANEQDSGAPQNGSVLVLDMSGPVGGWTVSEVVLPTGAPFDTTAFAGTPSDNLQPEYIDINAANKAIVSVQEANGLAVIDLPTGAVEKVFSAGTIDTTTDTGQTQNAPWSWDRPVQSARMPDAVAWMADGRHVLAASEGEQGYFMANGDEIDDACEDCGGRSWTVYDTQTGTVSADGGLNYEQEVARYGGYTRDAAEEGGLQPEGAETATLGGTEYGFVANERGASMAVLNLANPASPVMTQLLATGSRPEVIAVSAARDLVVASGEKLAGTLSFFRRESDDRPSNLIIPHGAGAGDYLQSFGGLGAAADGTFVAGLTSNDAPSSAVTIDPTSAPGPLAAPTHWLGGLLPGNPKSVDVAAATSGGGLWYLTATSLIRVAADGTVSSPVLLPQTGATGVAAIGADVYVSAGAKILRYDTVAGTFTSFAVSFPGSGQARVISDLDAAPDGRLAALVASDSARELWRIGVAGLADGAPVTDMTKVADLPNGPLDGQATYDLLAVQPDGEVWVGHARTQGNRDDSTPTTVRGLRSLGRLLAPAAGTPAGSVLNPPSPVPVPAGAQAITGIPGGFALTPDGAYFTGNALNQRTGGFAVVDASGEPDARFAPANLAKSSTNQANVAVADGSGGAYVGGSFKNYAGSGKNFLVHVLADGSVDPSFPADPPNNNVTVIGTGEGRVYVGGTFTQIGATPRARLAALSATTGAYDSGFLATSTALTATAQLLSSGGSLFVVNGRATISDGTTSKTGAVIKLNAATGLVDTTFAPAIDNAATSVTTAVAADGVLYVAGQLIVGGSEVDIAALDAATGSQSAGFVPVARPVGVDAAVTALAIAGGDLIVGGLPATNQVTSPSLAIAVDRATGAQRALAFPGLASTAVYQLAFQDGKLYVLGEFRDAAHESVGAAAFDLAGGERISGFEPMVTSQATQLALGNGLIAYLKSSTLGRPRHSVFRFDVAAGSFDPVFDAQVPRASGDIFDTLAGDAGRLYVGGVHQGKPTVIRLDPQTGAAVSGFDSHLLGSSVERMLLADDTLYITGAVTGGVQALDAETGARRTAFSSSIPNATALAQLPDGRLLAAYEGDPFTAFDSDGAAILDPVSGEVVGSVPLAAAARALAVTGDGSVFVGRESDDDALLRLKPDFTRDTNFAATAGGELTHLQLSGGRLLVSGESLEVTDGTATAAAIAIVDPDSGQVLPLADTATNQRAETGSSVEAAAALPDGRLIAFSTSDSVVLGSRITGTPAVGETLTCNTAGLLDRRARSGAIAIQWTRDGADIPAAASATYAVSPEDAGTALACRMTPAVGPFGLSENVHVVAAPPAATAMPTLPALVRPGDTVSCSGAQFDASDIVRYRWLLDGTPIAAADGRAYAVRDSDAGGALAGGSLVCEALGTNAAGASPAASAAANVRSLDLAPTGKPTATAPPAIQGSAIEGQTLTCVDAVWAQTFGADGVEWRRDGATVGSGDTYELAVGDAGHQIACVSLASNVFGAAASASAAVTPVAAAEKGDPGETGPPGTPGDPGDTGTPGAPGTPGSAGDDGAQGPQGNGGPQGASGGKGDAGVKGDPGAKGDTGAKGDPAKVTCTVVKSKRGKTSVNCKVTSAEKKASPRTIARLVRGGHTYASGTLAALELTRSLKPGRYSLVVGSGRTATIAIVDIRRPIER